jgi:hypothetical protein
MASKKKTLLEKAGETLVSAQMKIRASKNASKRLKKGIVRTKGDVKRQAAKKRGEEYIKRMHSINKKKPKSDYRRSA